MSSAQVIPEKRSRSCFPKFLFLENCQTLQKEKKMASWNAYIPILSIHQLITFPPSLFLYFNYNDWQQIAVIISSHLEIL